jgi:hypothetical protein
VSDNIENLGVRRFNQIDDPAAHAPVIALDAAREWIDSLEDGPEHVIVIVGRDMPDGASATRYFQAGKYRHHAVLGLCTESMHMIRESRDD